VAGAVLVLAGLGSYYLRIRADAARRNLDPAMGLLIGIRVLERDPGTALSREQITFILPYLKALKDIPVADAEHVRAVVRVIGEALTPAQREVLATMRARRVEREAVPPGLEGRRRGQAGQPGIAGPQAGPGGGLDPARLRARLFEATIRALERRLR
jgi:hypothetical protein